MVYTGTTHEPTAITHDLAGLLAALDDVEAGLAALESAAGGLSTEATVDIGAEHAATLRRGW
jgi:hypothetical protein